MKKVLLLQAIMLFGCGEAATKVLPQTTAAVGGYAAQKTDVAGDYVSDRWMNASNYSSDRWMSSSDYSSDRWVSTSNYSSDRWTSSSDYVTDRSNATEDYFFDRGLCDLKSGVNCGPKESIGGTVAGSPGPVGAQGPAGFPGAQGATGAVGAKGDKGDTGLQGAQGAKGDTGASGVSEIIKPCSNRSAKITRLPDGTLMSVTPADGQITLDWAASGSFAPSYSIGITNTCTVYVDYTGKVCTANPSKGLCATPL
jgi:hypothetical protein